ncbi:MAG TPA: hypothetical protein VMV17_04875 [Streptosporangiaceae bacterium]|nr:hypothetical protein [Streptosporangiaceae bacterium]
MMHRRITGLAVTAAAAGTAAIALVLPAGSLAGAATTASHPGIPAIYTTRSAGYVTGGSWRFRFVQTYVTVPPCPADPGNNTLASAGLAGGSGYLASIAIVCGGGASSVGYLDHHFRNGAFRLSPRVGDVLRISVYRDQKRSRDYFTVADVSTGRAQTVAVTTARDVVYRHAVLAVSVDNTKVSRPGRDLRLWSFQRSRVTSGSGVRGWLRGPWATQRLVDTATGTAAGTVIMSPSYPWRKGQHFGVWLRHH